VIRRCEVVRIDRIAEHFEGIIDTDVEQILL
jgi:hypothetical protein